MGWVWDTVLILAMCSTLRYTGCKLVKVSNAESLSGAIEIEAV